MHHPLLKLSTEEGTWESRAWSGGVRACHSLFLWGSHEEVTLPKLRGALMTIDPSLDKQTVNTYMSQAFQLPESELPEDGDEKEGGVVEILQTALERLQVIDIRRAGPREPEPAN